VANICIATSSLHSGKHQQKKIIILFVLIQAYALSPSPIATIRAYSICTKKGKSGQIHVTTVFALLFYQICTRDFSLTRSYLSS
jgi:hypothetical protein